jgi:hypothetical protein
MAAYAPVLSEAGGINPWLNAIVIAGGWYLGSPHPASAAIVAVAITTLVINRRVDWRKVMGSFI